MYGRDTLTDQDEAFKKVFKYYKSNKPKPSLSKVVSVDSCNTDQVTQITLPAIGDCRLDALGIQKSCNWKVYTFHKHPGLLMIRNPFTAMGQRYWIRRCLEEYPRKPNKSNLDRELDLEDWWSECHLDGKCNRVLQKKMRWTTLGYHHNWDTKIYSDDNKNTFPADLAELSDIFAKYLDYRSYKAEAAIVNYYHMDSTLSPHTDHSEVNLEAPLLSFSFGQSAIFLLGGQDKSIEPSPILLQSGDIVIMSKEARLCYHAVPKVLPAIFRPWRDKFEDINPKGVKFKYIKNENDFLSIMKENGTEKQWSRFNSYIEHSRINMNVRQVLNENQNSLSDDFIS